MNKKVNELIPKALDAITDSGMAEAGKVDKEYKGYISSMGASIIQSGLLATLAFYSNEQSGSVDKRRNLLKAIVKTLLGTASNEKLLNYVLSGTHNGTNKAEIDKYEKQISTTLIALKLALRTFKQKE
ncbi:MAG: type III-B CRISPR module-associated protein Cmr5 [Ignavibacteria bacterium]|jgi:CRISPR-associated protein Cmr5|nr:type III-B CRISPR module-associated protein Cmr5 [Ignavibacteria bacterium]MDP3829956.1 type III-B CRISPR module-associated protein Cmr5 [Ignavibacteriaceae bacterium]